MNRCAVSPKVVLVSADRGLRRQLRSCLLTRGLAAGALIMVRNEHECFTALVKARPCLLVLDDGVTNVDTQDLLRVLHRRAPEVLVVYLATCHTAELERAVRQRGVLYYAEKPPDLYLFGKILDSALASAAGPLGNRRRLQNTKSSQI